MSSQKLSNKKVFAFELDDVLFPKRDYLAQVFYLFSSFYEFSEGTINANHMAQFMCKVFDNHGEDEVFEATKTMFDIDEKYKENYDRLFANAQLPLKLTIYPKIKELIKSLKVLNKQIVILTKGNPVEQLNKLKQIDWEELSSTKSNLKIYFIDELKYLKIDPVTFISEEFNVNKNDILCFTENIQDINILN